MTCDKRRLFPFAVLTACTMMLAPSTRVEAQRLSLTDLLAVEPLGETALAPNGNTVAFVRGGQIALLPAEGGWPVMLTTSTGGKSGLSWAPDSRKIAFASQGGIWTVSLEGGQPKRLTQAAPGQGDPRQAADRQPQWSPNGAWILFETGRRGRNSINVVSQDGRTEKFLTASTADEVGAVWSPDGKHISYTERSPAYFSGKLNVLEFNSKTADVSDAATLYTAPTDKGGGWSIRKASWSPDSASLAVVLQESGWDHVYTIKVSGGTPKRLTSGEFEDSDPVFSPDGKSIAVVSNRKQLEQDGIWIVPVDGSSPHALTRFETPGVESAPEWSPDGQRLYFHRASPTTSPDLLVADVNGQAKPTFLTHTLPKNFEGALQTPKKIQYKSKDGTTISGILYEPRDRKPNVRYPAVLWIHGGPEAQDVFRLDLWAQYLAQQGYAVLEPNYRGSSGYGEKFRNANVEDSGGVEVDDVAAGAKYLVDRGIADAKRLAIGGGSHGGTMVAYAVTKYPTLFQAGIEMFGVVDRATFLQRTNRNSAVRWQMKMGGSQADKPAVYERANSLAKAATIQTPLLILHGENDPQVPPYESAQLVKALKEHNKTFYYFTYPGELHGFSQREHRLDAWRKELAFLEKYIKPGFGMSVTSTDDLMSPPPRPPSSAPAAPTEEGR